MSNANDVVRIGDLTRSLETVNQRLIEATQAGNAWQAQVMQLSLQITEARIRIKELESEIRRLKKVPEESEVHAPSERRIDTSKEQGKFVTGER